VALAEHEMIVTKDELDALHDDLYVLACAVIDTERDLAAAGPRAGRRSCARSSTPCSPRHARSATANWPPRSPPGD
jgi:hypothetical protein